MLICEPAVSFVATEDKSTINLPLEIVCGPFILYEALFWEVDILSRFIWVDISVEKYVNYILLLNLSIKSYPST